MKKYVIAAAFMALSAVAAGAYEPPASMFGQNNSFVASATNLAASNYTLGVKFTVNVAGTIRRLSFFKNSSDTTASRNLILWSSSGMNLAECTTANEPSGFNQWLGCNIPAFDVSSGITLYVSYDVPSGGHWNNNGPGVCLAQSPQTWITCNAIYYASALSTFPTTTTTWTELADIVLGH